MLLTACFRSLCLRSHSFFDSHFLIVVSKYRKFKSTNCELSDCSVKPVCSVCKFIYIANPKLFKNVQTLFFYALFYFNLQRTLSFQTPKISSIYSSKSNFVDNQFRLGVDFPSARFQHCHNYMRFFVFRFGQIKVQIDECNYGRKHK